MTTTMKPVDDVIGGHTGRSRVVLDYSVTMKRLVDEAKEPGFTAEGWSALADLVAVDELVRVGPFKEVMRWPEYADFLTDWARSSEWECSFKSITETGGRVFLELEERSHFGESRSVVNSLSVYEFDDRDRISRIDVYLQMAQPHFTIDK